MFKLKMFKVGRVERNEFCREIIESSKPDGDFYFFVILSTMIVALGIIRDNVVLVIGGMLVAPLLSPLLAVSLGIIIFNAKVILRSVRIFLVSFVLAAVVAYITGLIAGHTIGEYQLVKLMVPSVYTFMVALTAGLAASLTWIQPHANSTLPGVAITVTLIPPLTAIGLAAASQEYDIVANAFSVLMLNALSIIAASLVMFFFMNLAKAKRKIIAEVKEEERQLSNN